MYKEIDLFYKGVVLVIICLFLSCKNDPSPPLSPAQAMESFVLADPELEIQLVASEPLVQDPVAITFDEAGRLWVVEMLGFMQDIDGSGETEPIGRIRVLFDNNADGQMDSAQVFMDSLVLPRAIAVVKGGALVAENIPLWFAKDTDGDFIADSKVLIDSAYGGSGMPEHSGNGLWRGMDNWYYNAKSKTRYKYKNGDWVANPTEFRGQWGICHDNAGRLHYNYNWSQLHADLVPPNTLQRNKFHKPSSGIDHGLTLDRRIFPIRSNTAVNRGYVPGTLDDSGKLLEFASACGPLIYRGDLFSNAYLGNAFVCEPTANLIKRNIIKENGFMLEASAAYENSEFLASTDERFRPISLAPGPDGALYIVDMYKGIIQHGPYMTDYLREITLNRKLDKPIHMGRIWKITKKLKKEKDPVNLADLEASELVNYLGSTDGWTRDMAQRLLVENGDLNILPSLKKILEGDNSLGKLHALWTLEGLEYKEAELYLIGLNAQDSKVKQAALRIYSAFLVEEKLPLMELETYIKENFDSSDPALQLQMVLLSNNLNRQLAFEVSDTFLGLYGENPITRDVVMSSLQDREYAFFNYLQSKSAWQLYSQDHEIFIEQLSSAIAVKGSEQEILPLFEIISKPKENDWVSNAIITGFLNSTALNEDIQIELTSKPYLFTQSDIGEEDLKENYDQLNALFTWPGKVAPPQSIEDNLVELDKALMATGRQKYVNLCANCHGTKGEGMSRFAPPLKKSEWVIGEKEKLAMILLHGMEGPIVVNGKDYGIPDILPSMPSFSTLQNEDIAAIATYIRNSWGNSGDMIKPNIIGRIRFRTQGKITPWKASELDTVVFDYSL